MTFWRRSAAFSRSAPNSVPVADLLLGSLLLCQNSTSEDYSSDKEESGTDYPASSGAAVRKALADDHLNDSFVDVSTASSSSLLGWGDDLALKYAKAKARVELILNRCLYLYSKRGLDLQSLIHELKLEEAACKAPLKEFRDKWYEINVSKQKAETIYGGALYLPAAETAAEKEVLELPPFCDRGPSLASAESRPKTSRMAATAAAGVAGAGFTGFMRPATAKERTCSGAGVLPVVSFAEQPRLNEEWLNSLKSKSSMFSEELISLRLPELVPPTATKTFSALLDSRFK